MTLSDFLPVDKAVDVSVHTTLSWSDDKDSDLYEVYFGNDEDKVLEGNSSVYRGSTENTNYDPRVTLQYNTEYFWRIVAKKTGEDDVDSGVLSFTTIEKEILPENTNYQKRHCAIAGEKFWYDNDEKPPRKIALDGLTLETNSPLSIEEYQQKVYIVNGSILKVVDFVNTKLDVQAMANYPSRGSTLTQASSNAQMIVDFVNSDKTAIYGRTISSSFFDTEHVVSGGGMDTRTPSQVTEPTVPHHYDWTVYAGDTTMYGQLPPYATILRRYRNRLFLSGNPLDPHQWYLLRQDDPYDALYLAEDAQSPVAGQDADAGKVGDIVVDAIPYGDDYMLIGTIGSWWVMRGDPADGGRLDELDNSVGIICKDAWAKDHQKNLYVLDANGLYLMTYPLGRPEAIVDEDVIPTFTEDLNLNPKNQRITLGFDRDRKQVYICVTTVQTGKNANYVYDLVTQGFFPEEYPEECSVYSLHFYNADEPAYRKLLIGCADGYIRQFNDDAKDDDIGSLKPEVKEIKSYCLFGPHQIGLNIDREGVSKSFTFVSAGGQSGGSIDDSDGFDYEVYFEGTAEEVIEKCDARTSRFNGRISEPGRSYQQRIRGRGVFMGVLIKNENKGETWGMEHVSAVVDPAGEVRKL